MLIKVLLIEDEPTFIVGMTTVLEQEGYQVLTATDGESGMKLYKEFQPDLLLLDVNVPKKNGFQICKEIRQKDPDVAIIMLTNKQKDSDKVLGLENGADDYVVKGVSFEELFARMNSVMRRRLSKSSLSSLTKNIVFGDVQIDQKRLMGKKGSEEFEVTLREIQVLEIFIKNEGKVVTRETLLEEVWSSKNFKTTRILDQLILKLRRKIEDDPANPMYISTIHGIGYRFIASK